MTTLCNGAREGGGFMVSPDAKVNDGILQYVMVRKSSRPMMLRIVPEVMKGTHREIQADPLGSCRKLSMISDRPMYIHIDGEIYTSFGSNLRKLNFEILPNALKVVRG